MNELRSEHERQIYEQTNQNNQKFELIKKKYDIEKKTLQAKYKDEVNLKNEIIKDLERQAQKDKIIKEKSESAIRQLEDLKQTQDHLKADRDIVKQEKQILEERIKR